MPYLLFIIAICAGGVAGFYIASILKNKDLEVAKKEIDIEKRALEERGKDIDQLEARFKAIAGDVMRVHSKDFLDEFEKTRKIHNSDLEVKEKNFERIAEGINKSMEAVDKNIVQFEKQRIEQSGALGESIKNVLDTGAKMQETALSLKNVLSSSGTVRGRWGEAVLKNLLEQSGLTEGIDFNIQETIIGDEASLRPDVIINLPGSLKLVIDSKAVLEEFFKAVEEKDSEKKTGNLTKFAQDIRSRIKDLSTKEYQKYLDSRIPYVVMFIPSEAAVRAAFEHDTNLYSEAQEKRVMLASPATIMPMILLIAHAWKQQKTVENASKLASEINELSSRLKAFLGHVVGIGTSLSSATKKFNEAANSWDSRVYTKIEQINTLGGNMDISSEIQKIEVEPRNPSKLLETSKN
ncbi:MAG: DNA recombination protein RmuC [Candidatus Pacebacteria bacterium]|nr:DNA recombination protein RmuC [Candidatus Paceibacterota bacterium]